MISGRVRALNLTVPLGSGRVGSDDLGYGPGSGFSFEPVQTSNWDMFRAASDDDIEAYSDTVTCFIRKCIDDVVPTKTIHIYPNQKPWINSDVRSALSARTSAFKSVMTIGNKPVTISGDPSKQPNEHIKTKLKNISTTIIQEACGRALTTSQALKGINQLL